MGYNAVTSTEDVLIIWGGQYSLTTNYWGWWYRTWPSDMVILASWPGEKQSSSIPHGWTRTRLSHHIPWSGQFMVDLWYLWPYIFTPSIDRYHPSIHFFRMGISIPRFAPCLDPSELDQIHKCPPVCFCQIPPQNWWLFWAYHHIHSISTVN